jgi:hypothetical protein
MMTISGVRQFARSLTVAFLAPILGFAASPPVQHHVVSPDDLRKEAVAASSARQQNLETINDFLSSPKAEKVLARAGIDPAGLKAAVSSLNEQELARLAARADKAQADFAAGNLSERDLLLILIGLAALILIIVAVR